MEETKPAYATERGDYQNLTISFTRQLQTYVFPLAWSRQLRVSLG